VIRGTVAKTYTRDWQGEDGVICLHSFQLQGDKRYFRTGTEKLVSEGDYITFDVEGNNNVVPPTLEVGKAKTVAPAAPRSGTWTPRPAFRQGAAAAGKSENFEARQKYWENKEQRDIEVVEPRITLSAAQRDAIEVVKVALQHDLLSFGNAAKAAKLHMLLDYVDEVAARFYFGRMNAAETVAGFAPDTGTDKGGPEGSDGDD
jgi:hypothetical protein